MTAVSEVKCDDRQRECRREVDTAVGHKLSWRTFRLVGALVGFAVILSIGIAGWSLKATVSQGQSISAQAATQKAEEKRFDEFRTEQRTRFDRLDGKIDRILERSDP